MGSVFSVARVVVYRVMNTNSDSSARPLIDWVLALFPGTPKKRAKQWITGGRVSVGNVVIFEPHRKMADPGPSLSLLGRSGKGFVIDSAVTLHPNLTLLYADSSFAVVNKGPGLLSVPARRERVSALQILSDALEAGRFGAKPLPLSFRHLNPMPVHRLDRFSSGVFCIAMNPGTREKLIQLFSTHDITREYIAYVDGKPTAARGTWKNWLLLSADEQHQEVVTEREAKAGKNRGMEAISHYEVMEEFIIDGDPTPAAPGKPTRIITKLRVELVTGARHQIRIQAAHAGIPIIGDRTYHPLYAEDEQKVPIAFDRQALHAAALGFVHPDIPGTRLSWTATLPRDLIALEKELRARR